MKRSHLLLAVLGAVLLIAVFWLLLFQPQRDRLAEVEEEIAVQLDQQAQETSAINRLRGVRDEAPEVEAQLAAAEAIVPRDAALPAALRQLQLAADESGLVLRTITTGRPSAVAGDTAPGLAALSVQVQLSGAYFQVVDFLRRVEDPTISPRGLTWESASLSRDEYPTLNVALAGSIYALIDEMVPEPAPAPEPDPDNEDDGEANDENEDADEDDPDDEEETAASATSGEVRS